MDVLEKERKNQVKDVLHLTDLDSLLVEAAAAYDLHPETTVGILVSTTVWLPERICVSQRGLVESPSPSARPGNL